MPETVLGAFQYSYLKFTITLEGSEYLPLFCVKEIEA